MKEPKVMVVTQKVDENDDVLGSFCGWINELAKKIDKIYVVALEKEYTDLAKNIELYSLGKENGANKLNIFLKFNKILISLCLNKKIDIILIHMCPEYSIWVFPYAKLMKIPIVMWYAHGCANIKLRTVHFLVNKVVTSSKEGFRIKSNKVIITGQGIDINKFRIQNSELKIGNSGKKIVLLAGRISPIKNYESLIKAADILVNQKNIRDLEFQIVGGVPKESQNRYLHFLKNLAREYKLEDYVQFIGPVPYTQIQSYYQNCNLFISASLTGSLDKSTLEAMACGKVILTCNEAFKDVLGIHSNRLMFRKGNAIELAEKISSLLQIDEKLQEELGQDLRNIVVKRHSLNRLIDRLGSVFHDLI